MTVRETAHPGTMVYIVVAVILTVLTAMEVTAFYVQAVKPILLPLLLILSAAKFVLVAMFYMHLKFDSWRYSTIFVGQLFFAAAVIIMLGLLMVQRQMAQAQIPQGQIAQGQIAQGQIAQAGNAAAAIFQKSCATCHGTDGRGDGPAAMALDPKPQDFKDCKNMAAKSDETLFKAVKGGGHAVGLSPIMPPWGGTYSDEQIHGLVQYVRTFCQ
jgi:mono/diheme cytochrome c family protein